MIEPRATEFLLGYTTGSVDAQELNEQVGRAWSEILQDPAARAEAASLLQVPIHRLQEAGTAPPVSLKPEESGTGVVETAVIVFVTTVGYDLLKDLTKDAAKAALLTLWERVIKPRVERILPLGAFGEESRIQDASTGPPSSRS